MNDLIIRGQKFDFSKTTYVMGILNVTPDSFSDGGLHNSTDDAVNHALRMVDEGASIIDIGGESTRPGHEAVDETTELSRVIPVIEALRKKSDIPVSVDTTKESVALAAIAAGADIINTVQGAGISDGMLKAAAESDAAIVLTYEKAFSDIFIEDLEMMAKNAEDAGIRKDRIIIDPGVGFGKSFEDNLHILDELPLITRIDHPVLLGTSRKSVIGNVLNVPENERLGGTITTTVLAGLAGVGIVRVHDVSENVKALKMLGAICEVSNGSYQH